jgi:hypothetical protein
LNGLPHVAANKQAVHAEVLGKLGSCIGGWPLSVEVDDFNVSQAMGLPHHFTNKHLWCGRNTMQIKPMSRLNSV